MQAALRVAGSRPLRRVARRSLRDSFYARSSRKARQSKLRTIRKLLRAMGAGYLPITPASLEELASVLVSCHYRSFYSYLSLWKKEHVVAGHAWTEALEETRKDCKRAGERGLGPTRKAPTFTAENLAVGQWGDEPLHAGGPRLPALAVAVGILWLLRGAELADLLGEQATVNLAARTATLDLCAFKTDTTGRGCERTLRCSCATRPGPCPFCVLEMVLVRRKALSLGPKDPLFPTARGRSPSSKNMVKTIRTVTGLERATEHSLRRCGAQLLARRGLPLYLIQFLGRWGGVSVCRYVAEELKRQLALRSAASAAGDDGEGAGGPIFASWAALRREVLSLVRAALPKTQKGDEGTTEGRAAASVLERGLHAPSAITLGGPVVSPKTVRPYQGAQGVGKVHEVIVCDPCLPREAWITRCGWNFGCSSHLVGGDDAVTCSDCTKFAERGIARPAKRKRGE